MTLRPAAERPAIGGYRTTRGDVPARSAPMREHGHSMLNAQRGQRLPVRSRHRRDGELQARAGEGDDGFHSGPAGPRILPPGRSRASHRSGQRRSRTSGGLRSRSIPNGDRRSPPAGTPAGQEQGPRVLPRRGTASRHQFRQAHPHPPQTTRRGDCASGVPEMGVDRRICGSYGIAAPGGQPVWPPGRIKLRSEAACRRGTDVLGTTIAWPPRYL